MSDKNENAPQTKNFIENTIDLILKTKDNTTIELPFIYNSLVSKIPEDADEKSILADMLKKKGFNIIYWGRGNYPPRGERIVSITLQKGDCVCEVNKIYYSTLSDTLYEVAERIKCADSLTYATGKSK
ncbi:MAG: hypothetical protein ACTHMM_07200 [Agriterribacter sp.]